MKTNISSKFAVFFFLCACGCGYNQKTSAFRSLYPNTENISEVEDWLPTGWIDAGYLQPQTSGVASESSFPLTRRASSCSLSLGCVSCQTPTGYGLGNSSAFWNQEIHKLKDVNFVHKIL